MPRAKRPSRIYRLPRGRRAGRGVLALGRPSFTSRPRSLKRSSAWRVTARRSRLRSAQTFARCVRRAFLGVLQNISTGLKTAAVEAQNPKSALYTGSPTSVGSWPARELPKGRRRTDLPCTSVAGRRQHSIILKNRQRFFCRCNQLRTYARAMPAATLTRCLRRALGKEDIMHATLSPSWKKSLLPVFVSVVAFATATPATSRPQCFFQGLGFLPGGTSSAANGVNADGTVVVGGSNGQAFRWVNGTMTGLGFLPGPIFKRSEATGVNADGRSVIPPSPAASSGPKPSVGRQRVAWSVSAFWGWEPT